MQSYRTVPQGLLKADSGQLRAVPWAVSGGQLTDRDTAWLSATEAVTPPHVVFSAAKGDIQQLTRQCIANRMLKS
ncbi:hypothetical protein ACOMHN_024750 [Nucella lapillus]